EVPAAESPASVVAIGDGLDVDVERYDSLEALGEAIDGGAAAPDAVLLDAEAHSDGEPVAHAVHTAAQRMLGVLQAWLADERLSDTRLVLITRRALAVRDGESPDVAAAPLAGLIRSARSEHPDRFALVDVDGTGE